MIRAKHLLAFFLLLATPSVVAAQEGELPPVQFPSLPDRAADAAGFVPAGWRLEASASGDLDEDGRSDLALVLRMTDPRNIIANEGGLCGETLDTNPRMIAVALASRSGGYHLGVENGELIPRRNNACAEDPFGAPDHIVIEHKTVRIYLERLMSAGGWDAGTTSFSFRWADGDLQLIGFDYSNVQRNTGALSLLSINYLTGRAKITQGRIDSDDETVRWVRLHMKSSPSIGTLGNGLEYDPENLVSNLP